MSKATLYSALSVLFLSACGGEASPPTVGESKEINNQSIESKNWKYELANDPMTGRSLHTLHTISDGSANSNVELIVECDRYPNWFIDNKELSVDIPWGFHDQDDKTVRDVVLSNGSGRISATIYKGGQVYSKDPRHYIRFNDHRFAKDNAFKDVVFTQELTGSKLSNTEKDQLIAMTDDISDNLRTMLSGQRLLLQGLYGEETISFPDPSKSGQTEIFLKACKSSIAANLGVNIDPSDASNSNEPTTTTVISDNAVSQTAPDTTSVTAVVATDSIEVSESGDGFSFSTSSGKNYYVVSNQDSEIPGVNLIVESAKNQTPICLTFAGEDLAKVEQGDCL